jgi:hypothetical protein
MFILWIPAINGYIIERDIEKKNVAAYFMEMKMNRCERNAANTYPSAAYITPEAPAVICGY